MRGRKPTPTALKKLRGNPGRRPLNEDEPTPKAEAPPCPDWLDEDARATWEWLVEELRDLGLLASSDQALLALYCDTWSQLQQIRRRRADKGEAQFLAPTRDGEGFYRHPLFDIEGSLKKELRACMTELGLTPSSRSRLHANPKKKQKGASRFFRPKVVG